MMNEINQVLEHQVLRDKMLRRYGDLYEDKKHWLARVEDGRFVYAKDHWGQGSTEPHSSLIFVSNYGYIVFDFWNVTNNGKVVVEISLYSQGLNGEIRGKGNEATKATTDMLVQFSRILYRPVIGVAITHRYSDHVPRECGFQQIEHNLLRTLVENSDAVDFAENRIKPAENKSQQIWIRELLPTNDVAEMHQFTEEETRKISWMLQNMIAK